MNIRRIPVNNVRLRQGEVFFFRILKQVSLDGKECFWVLQDPTGYKVLLPAGYYLNYGFEPGQMIRCRVDKINCNGRMFLEPMHPHYKEGEVYSFSVSSWQVRDNLLGEPRLYYQVQDIHGQQWEVVSARSQPPDKVPSALDCLLERIRKGRLYLRLAREDQPQLILETGKWYPFTLEGIRQDESSSQEYYLMRGPDKQQHLVPARYYLHYGLRPGQQVECRVEKFSGEGYFILEPRHPRYQIGHEYSFKVRGLEELVFSDQSSQMVVVLTDDLGMEVKVQLSPGQLQGITGQKELRALVRDIRKSRPELELVLPQLS